MPILQVFTRILSQSPVEVLQEVSEEWIDQLGWTRTQREQFIQKVFGTPEAELSKSDWEVLLFELQMQIERSR